MSFTRVVAITGCDSGLGWALAARMARDGMVTVAGMYNGVGTNAAKALQNYNVHPCHLDVTKTESVAEFKQYVTDVVNSNSNYKLYAVVNNAGVMTIGDYEWQSQQLIEEPVNVNLLGAMRVISSFLPDLRRAALEGFNPRLVNVTSHCGLQPLPGFGPYSASKAGLYALTKALRLENRPYGLSVLAFVPGGFVGTSNLITKQVANFTKMQENLDEEQKAFHEKKIMTLSNYLAPAGSNASYDSMTDETILETFMKALKEDNPKELHKVESWRYMFYYNLLKLPMPENVRDMIVKRFVNFPDVN